MTETVVVDKLQLSPRVYKAFELDTTALAEVLRKAPMEFTEPKASPVTVSLPLPTGSFGRFEVEESPSVEPKLAERYPWLKSYKARGLDDPTASVRMELTPSGFHAMVLSESGTFFIDPASSQNSLHYISYLKADLPDDPKGFQDTVVRRGRRPRVPPHHKHRVRKPRKPRVPKELHLPYRHHASPAASDGFLRIYRLAVAASHTYVAAIKRLNHPNGSASDLIPDTLEAIHRTINRVNTIYETELGIRFVLVANEDQIIFTQGPDPYTCRPPTRTSTGRIRPGTCPQTGGTTDTTTDSNDDDNLLDTNQRVLDRLIEKANYDVGHLFIAGRGGGRSSQPCACNNFFKANGFTGRLQPQGDAFDVDYVAHEIGHQFGASHSFNGTTLRCDRNRATAYEPGSGSTIMGYAGPTICGPESVQDHSDAYFHAISLEEINRFITNRNSDNGGDVCARKIASGNSNRPVVNGGANHVIPRGTPFTLTIQSSSDADGDQMVYNWEEFDLGAPDPPDPNNLLDFKIIRPVFRSRMWGRELSRTFPRLANILNNPPATTYTAEAMPAVNRTMTFRVTARDQRGRYGYDTVLVGVAGSRKVTATRTQPVGPFVVTQPSGGEVWPKLSTQTVSWAVANTQLTPVSCLSVKISLLIIGDESHPIILLASTPNNGSSTIIVPSTVPAGNARIKVEAVDNIFFNISGGNIQIR